MDSSLLYQDPAIAVAVKPFGVMSEHHQTDGMPELIAKRIRCAPEEVYPVHRLDMDAGGIMVYGLNRQAAAALSSAFSGRKVQKRYLAIIEGTPETSESMWKDYLFWDSRRRKSYRVKTARKGVKEAVLFYRQLDTCDGLTLLAIRLETGRTHQIRCQCASRGMPIAGDRRYGGQIKCEGIALWSVEITFPHPVSGKTMRFQAPPPASGPWTLFSSLYQKTEEK